MLEVGLGGRLDATNVVPAGLTIVTGIEKEHTRHLGTTLAQIAREKAGVIKRGAGLLTGVTSPAARRSIAQVARERGVRPRWLDDEAKWEVTGHTLRGMRMDLSASGEDYRGLRLGILGRHQARNAALAVLAARELHRRGFPVGKAAIRA